MVSKKRMSRILKVKMEIVNYFDAELQLVPAVEKAEEQILTIEEQNEVMAKKPFMTFSNFTWCSITRQERILALSHNTHWKKLGIYELADRHVIMKQKSEINRLICL